LRIRVAVAWLPKALRARKNSALSLLFSDKQEAMVQRGHGHHREESI